MLRLAAYSGSIIAFSATIGNVAHPNQAARGFDKRLILGSIGAGGTLGILIPPSIIMGTLFEGLSMMIVTLLFVLPLLVAANVDLIWFESLLWAATP